MERRYGKDNLSSENIPSTLKDWYKYCRNDDMVWMWKYKDCRQVRRLQQKTHSSYVFKTEEGDKSRQLFKETPTVIRIGLGILSIGLRE